jgi:hypothetical protein
MENAPRKGMSKGCMVALIIVGALVVVAIILMVTCYIYKDDLAKMGANTLVSGLKVELAKHEYPDIDTVQFNTLADAFVERLDEEKPLDFQTYSVFMGTLQTVMGDNKFGADEVAVVQEAFVLYYPELEELLPEVNKEPEVEFDSASTEL